MAVVRALVLSLAILAVLCLPAVFALLLCADEIIDRAAWNIDERREARRQRRTISRLNRAVGPLSVPRDSDLAALERPDRPTIEQIAADLRRLGGQRLGLATRSIVWQTAVLRAYDDRLRMASRCLGVAEHLDQLDGVDLEIERVRVEGELHSAGLMLPTVRRERRREQR